MPPKVPNTIAVDISKKQEMKTVGGQMSKRLPINVKMEDGSVVKGFYTESTYTNFDEKYNAAIEEAKSKVKSTISSPDKYIALLDDIKKNISPYEFYYALSLGSKIEDYADIEKKNVFGEENTWTRFALEKMKERRPSFGSADKYMSLFSNKEFGKIMNSIAQDGFSLGAASDTALDYAKQEKGKVNINKRNNALYRVSEKIGDPDLICKSVNMITTNNGVQSKGTFMLNAKGTEFKDIKPVTIKTSKRIFTMNLIFSGSAVRDLSKLQVIDYLTANIDRHVANMFYNMEYIKGDKKKGTPDKMAITGVQGIDNDLSFGTLDGKSQVSYMSALNDIKIIDKNQAEGIMKMTADDFEEIMREAGLGRTEVEAGLNRLKNLKERISTKEIRQIDGNEWDTVTPKKYVTHNKNRTNTFGKVQSVLDAYVVRMKESITLDEFLAKKQEQPATDVSEIMNESEKLLYQSQLDDLEELKEAFDKTNPEKASPEFKKMYDGLKDLITTIQEKAIKKEEGPGPNEINLISEKYKELEGASAYYISKKSKNPFSDNGKERLHLAKNLRQQTKTGRHMVIEESTASFNNRMTAETNKVFEKYQSLIEIDTQLKEKGKTATPEFLADQIKKINAMSDNFKDDKTFDYMAAGLESNMLKQLGQEKGLELLGADELKKCHSIVNKHQVVRVKDVVDRNLLHEALDAQKGPGVPSVPTGPNGSGEPAVPSGTGGPGMGPM